MERRKKYNCFFWICIHGWLNFSSKIEKNKGDSDFKESYPSNAHCAHLFLFLSGASFQLIPYMGKNKQRERDRKILLSIVEVMDVSECEDFHSSDGNLSEDGRVEVNASIAALRRISFEAAKH